MDDRLRVRGVPGGWLYAVGDCNGRARPLTHMGKYQGRLAGDVIAGRDAVDESDQRRGAARDVHRPAGGRRRARPRPRRATRASTCACVRVRHRRRRRARTRAATTSTGTCQLVVDESRHVVVGATFTGPDVQELLHAATIAIVGEVPLERLWHAVPSFPTVSEVWLRLLEAYGL